MGKAATTGGAGAKRGKSSTSSGDKVAAVEKEVLAALSIRGKAECITVPSAAADEVTLEAADDTIARALARLKLQAQDGKGPLHPYWHKRLAGLTRPAARALIPQLTHENALGFDAASGLGNGAAIGGVQQARRTGGGTLFDYVLAQKKAHPDKVCRGVCGCVVVFVCVCVCV